MGVITVVVGGMLRDVLCNEVPLVLRQELYAVACAIGVVIYLILLKLGLHMNFAVSLSILAIFVIRVTALYRRWRLPELMPSDE